MNDDIIDAPTAVTLYIHIVERDEERIGRWEWAVTEERDLPRFWKAYVGLGNWGFSSTRKAAIRAAKRRARKMTAEAGKPPSERKPKYERYVFTREIT